MSRHEHGVDGMSAEHQQNMTMMTQAPACLDQHGLALLPLPSAWSINLCFACSVGMPYVAAVRKGFLQVEK